MCKSLNHTIAVHTQSANIKTWWKKIGKNINYKIDGSIIWH